MHPNPYFSWVYSTAKVGIKMHALSLCFISAACSVLFIAVPTNEIFFILGVIRNLITTKPANT